MGKAKKEKHLDFKGIVILYASLNLLWWFVFWLLKKLASHVTTSAHPI